MIPIKVKVCGVPYTVRLDGTVDAATDDMVGGEITYNLCDIRLAVNLAPEYEKRTLWHELFHAMFAHTGHTEYINDEKLIETLSNVVVQVIEDNPDLVRYTQSETTNQ